MSKFLQLFLIAVYVLVAFPALAATMDIKTSVSSAVVGSNIDIPVHIDPAGESVDTARAVLEYDPRLLKAVGFFLSSPLNMTAPSSFIDGKLGLMSWGGFNIIERITSPTTFGVARFQPLAPGEATVALMPTSHVISGGREVGVGIKDQASIRISPSPQQQKQEQEKIATPDPAPEYNYRIMQGSALCFSYTKSFCDKPWWTALLAGLALVTVLVAAYFWHRHQVQQSETTI